jgi:hypothetical protein
VPHPTTLEAAATASVEGDLLIPVFNKLKILLKSGI